MKPNTTRWVTQQNSHLSVGDAPNVWVQVPFLSDAVFKMLNVMDLRKSFRRKFRQAPRNGKSRIVNPDEETEYAENSS